MMSLHKVVPLVFLSIVLGTISPAVALDQWCKGLVKVPFRAPLDPQPVHTQMAKLDASIKRLCSV